MQYWIYVYLVPLAALAILAALFYAWQRRTQPGAPALIAYLAAVTGFLLLNLFELLAPDETSTLFWARLNYLFIVSLPVTWLAFALQYTGKAAWLTPGRFWIFCVEPLLTLLLAMTNAQHGLVWSSVRFHTEAGFLALQVEHGLWFWVHVIYALGLLLGGALIVAGAFFGKRSIYSHQSAWVLAGVLTPLLVNGVYLFDLAPGLTKDFSPIAFALAGLAFTRGIVKHRLLTVMPITRQALVDTLPEGLLVLDSTKRVVDLNDSARELLGLNQEERLLGSQVSQIWPATANWDDDPTDWPEVITIRRGPKRWACALHVTQLPDEEVGRRGWLIVLGDVTRLVDTEEALEQANRALGETNAALRRLNEELEERIKLRTRSLSQRAEELEALARVSAALRKAGGLEELFDILLVETSAVLEACGAGIFLLDDEELLLSAAYRLPASPGVRLLPSRDRLWRVVETGQLEFLAPIQQAVDDEARQISQILTDAYDGIAIAPIRTGNRILGVLFLVYDHPPAGDFLAGAGHLLTAIAEITGNAFQRVRVVENLEALVQSRTRDLSALYEVTATTNQPRELGDLLQHVLAIVLDVLDLQAALIYLNEENGLFSEPARLPGFDSQDASPLFWDGNGSSAQPLFLAAYAGLDTSQVALLPGATDCGSPWQQVLAEGMIVVRPLLADPIRVAGMKLEACVGVPVRAKGHTLGVLSVLDESLGRLSAEDIALLAAIADHVGGAVERSRLRRRAEQAAVIEERQRLARDLHDSVTQSIYSLVLFAEAGGDALQAGNVERASSHLVRLRDTAQQALKEMRLLIYELRPAALEREGLVGALRNRLETVERRAGIDAQLEVESLAPLPDQFEAGLYGIAQEALNNVLKHAHATHVKVRLSAEHQCVDLEITDNGRGFPEGERLEGGIGLTSMRERARAMGGTLSIRSETGRGASVLVTIRKEERS